MIDSNETTLKNEEEKIEKFDELDIEIDKNEIVLPEELSLKKDWIVPVQSDTIILKGELVAIDDEGYGHPYDPDKFEVSDIIGIASENFDKKLETITVKVEGIFRFEKNCQESFKIGATLTPISSVKMIGYSYTKEDADIEYLAIVAIPAKKEDRYVYGFMTIGNRFAKFYLD